MATFPLRLPDHVMSDAKRIAERSGTSLNQLFLSMIAERIGAIKAMDAIERRAERADVAKALAVLSRVPDVPHVEGDELEEDAPATSV
jgi:hypothetical protein